MVVYCVTIANLLKQKGTCSHPCSRACASDSALASLSHIESRRSWVDASLVFANGKPERHASFASKFFFGISMAVGGKIKQPM